MTLEQIISKQIDEYNIVYIVQDDKFAYLRPEWAKNYFEGDDSELESIEFMSPKNMDNMMRLITGVGGKLNRDWVDDAMVVGTCVLTLRDYHIHLEEHREFNYVSDTVK